MDAGNVATIITALAGLLAAGAAWWKLRGLQKVQDAEALDKVFSICAELSAELEKEQVRRREQGKRMIILEKELQEMKVELSLYQAGVNRLIGQLQSHGITPVWTPERKDE